MSITSSARRLSVIDIFDYKSDLERDQRCQAIRAEFGQYIEYDVIHEWLDAQERLASDEELRPDIILLDIAFTDDQSLGDGAWALFGKEPLKTVGPLLALPFLCGREVVSIGPYSTHWEQIDLYREPMLLATLGLLLAKVRHRTSTWDSLAKDLCSIQSLTLGTPALWAAIRRYRQELRQAIKGGRVGVMGAAAAVERLSLLRDRALKKEKVTMAEPMALRFYFSSGEDDILLASLFADRLHDRRAGEETAVLQEMIDWLSGDDSFEYELKKAVRALKQINAFTEQAEAAPEAGNRDEDEPRRGRRRGTTLLDHAIARHFGEIAGTALGQARRLCVLLAHVKAEYEFLNRPSGDSATIYERVNRSLGVAATRSYQDLFGHRLAKPDAHHVQRFEPGQTFHPQEGTRLSPAELCQCQYYAKENLRWLNLDQWPAWLRRARPGAAAVSRPRRH